MAIPAYRDTELVPTVFDALAKAADPAGLRFGICWQRTEGESIAPLDRHPQVRIIEREHSQARGVGWARSLAGSLYDGEDHVLQTDSHMRFVPGWDKLLIENLRRAPSAKPMLSTWGLHYWPGQPLEAKPPARMVFHRWDPNGGPAFRILPILDAESRTAPVPVGFVCAHMMFSAGAALTEVPNDPYIYFYGEEITTSVRLFTRGWDMFAPLQQIVWHHWGVAKTRVRHWEDHDTPDSVNQWQRLEKQSQQRVRSFLASPSEGRYGVGTVRSLADFEAYVGITFKDRIVSEAAMAGAELPVLAPTSS